MATAIALLENQSSLRDIFRTLQNQEGPIFSNVHNAHSASIITCLEKLGNLITPPDKEDRLYDLRSFIENGVCHIARNYEMNPTVSPDVLNFLMTAIRSYNHIVAISGGEAKVYHFEPGTCRGGVSSTGNAFLLQVLVPLIDAGALHVFPTGAPIAFDVNVPELFVERSPSPEYGPRQPGVSFGKAVEALNKPTRRRRRRVVGSRYVSGSSASSSGNSSGNSSGGRRSKCSRRVKRRT